jgi:simple sugar transport system ATP-binding protein
VHLVIRDLSKTYPNGTQALKDVSLDVPVGMFGLLGRNGAGKSTLMSILSGIYRPDEGRILVDGRAVNIDSPRHGRDLGIGMVYQHLSLIPTLTVLENLMMGSNPGLSLDRQGARTRLGELSAQLGVTVDADARAGSLALGQQQQVEIIKALWKGSRVLILDEPTSSLDPDIAEKTRRALERIRRERGLAILYTSHNMAEVERMCDRVVFLHRGRVVADGSPLEVSRRILGSAALDEAAMEEVFLKIAREGAA